MFTKHKVWKQISFLCHGVIVHLCTLQLSPWIDGTISLTRSSKRLQAPLVDTLTLLRGWQLSGLCLEVGLSHICLAVCWALPHFVARFYALNVTVLPLGPECGLLWGPRLITVSQLPLKENLRAGNETVGPSRSRHPIMKYLTHSIR